MRSGAGPLPWSVLLAMCEGMPKPLVRAALPRGAVVEAGVRQRHPAKGMRRCRTCSFRRCFLGHGWPPQLGEDHRQALDVAVEGSYFLG